MLSSLSAEPCLVLFRMSTQNYKKRAMEKKNLLINKHFPFILNPNFFSLRCCIASTLRQGEGSISLLTK